MGARGKGWITPYPVEAALQQEEWRQQPLDPWRESVPPSPTYAPGPLPDWTCRGEVIHTLDKRATKSYPARNRLQQPVAEIQDD